MILMIEQDRKNGGWRWPAKVEKIGLMTRIIIGWWSVAYFKQCGINDVWKIFRKTELEEN